MTSKQKTGTTFTRAQFEALAWAALFTEANIEGYYMTSRLTIAPSGARHCMRFTKCGKRPLSGETLILGFDGERHLRGGMTPTHLFLKEFKRRLHRIGVEVTDVKSKKQRRER